jgi:PAS domain S-box-containing protein
MSIFRILIVDDSPDDALLAERSLRAAGLTIATLHATAEDDLTRALLEQEWDIILSDFSMPLLDFAIILDLAARHAPGVPVVLVTGTIGDEAVAELMRQGLSDVVLKGSVSKRLGLVVRREVDRARSDRRSMQRQHRTDCVLEIFQSTTDWRAAIQKTLAYLGASFGAVGALMSEAIGVSETLSPIATWSHDAFTHALRVAPDTPRPLHATLAGQALLSDRPLLMPDLSQVPVEKRSFMLRAIMSAGATALLCQPIRASGRRFLLSLVFDSSTALDESILEELHAISKALQPALFRRISEGERALLINALDVVSSGVLITEAHLIDMPGPRIVYANRAVAMMSGYTQAELLSHTPRVLQGPLTDPATLAVIRSGLTNEKPVSVELINHHANGSPFRVALDITPMHDDDRLTHFVAIQTDITKQHAADQQRQEREASFRLMFENNPIPMWVYEIGTGRFLEVNTAAIKRFGWSREEFLARYLDDVRNSSDFKDLNSDDDPENPSSTLALHYTASGTIATFRTTSTVIDHDGRKASLAALWDVTEIERARDALFRNNVELAKLTEDLRSRTADLESAARLARIGTWRMRFNPREVIWSPETFTILGRDPNSFEPTRQNIMSCIHPEDLELFKAYTERARTQGTTQEREYRVIRPNGEVRVIHEIARPVHEPRGVFVGLSGMIQDVTEQHIAKAALLHSEKLKTIGQITGAIAHDFNNLLTVIGLNLETVLESDDLPGPLRSILEPAIHATRRSATLTGQMLSYARRQSLTPQITDLQSLVETAFPLLERAVGDRGKLTLIPRDDTDYRTRIDPADFENSLMNLVINARDAVASKAGDKDIFLSIALAEPLVPLEAVPDTVPAGSYLCVTVRDTGTGIPADILARIFEPFFTTKPLGSGSGLGLSMVYGFVRQSNGFVTIDSIVGVGTRISLYFPIVHGREVAEDGAGPSKGSWNKQNHVLLVEDGDDLRHTMHRLFSDLGFTTTSVKSANAALDELMTSRRYDLLISDVALGGDLDGIQLAEEAETLRPKLRIVLMSGHIPDGNIPRSKWKVMRKPFTIATLSDALSGG